LSQLADFLLDAGCASEFEVFPEAAALPQEEETTGELWIRGIVIFLQLRFARACSALTPDRARCARNTLHIWNHEQPDDYRFNCIAVAPGGPDIDDG